MAIEYILAGYPGVLIFKGTLETLTELEGLTSIVPGDMYYVNETQYYYFNDENIEGGWRLIPSKEIIDNIQPDNLVKINYEQDIVYTEGSPILVQENAVAVILATAHNDVASWQIKTETVGSNLINIVDGDIVTGDLIDITYFVKTAQITDVDLNTINTKIDSIKDLIPEDLVFYETFINRGTNEDSNPVYSIKLRGNQIDKYELRLLPLDGSVDDISKQYYYEYELNTLETLILNDYDPNDPDSVANVQIYLDAYGVSTVDELRSMFDDSVFRAYITPVLITGGFIVEIVPIGTSDSIIIDTNAIYNKEFRYDASFESFLSDSNGNFPQWYDRFAKLSDASNDIPFDQTLRQQVIDNWAVVTQPLIGTYLSQESYDNLNNSDATILNEENSLETVQGTMAALLMTFSNPGSGGLLGISQNMARNYVAQAFDGIYLTKCTPTEDFSNHVIQDIGSWKYLYNKILSLENTILDIKANNDNKILNTDSTVNIENTTYTINNEYGGRITGVGSKVVGLLGLTVLSTGVVTIDDKEEYNNAALLSGPAEPFTKDVDNGATIISSGMESLIFTPYILKS